MSNTEDQKRYQTDLTDEQWHLIKAHYAKQYNRQGRPPSKDLREIWNGILYINHAGCSWRMLPKCFPTWRTVYKHLRSIRKSGKLEIIMQDLHQKARISQNRNASPSIGIVDAQSVKSLSPGKKSERL